MYTLASSGTMICIPPMIAMVRIVTRSVVKQASRRSIEPPPQNMKQVKYPGTLQRPWRSKAPSTANAPRETGAAGSAAGWPMTAPVR
jgi:hypothetical protein